MRKGILRYDGLFGDEELNASSEFLQCESLELRSKAFDWEIAEHFHSDLYQLFLFRSGSGTYSLNQSERSVRSNQILFIPVNTLHGFQFGQAVEGEVLTLSSGIFDQIFKNRPEMMQGLLSQLEFDLSSQEGCFQRILTYYDYLKSELHEQKKEKWTVQRNLLELIFTELYRSSHEAQRQELITSHRSLGYYQGFVTAIKQEMDQSISVSIYAARIGITVVHLNRVCREVVGKSALEVVQEILLQEAKNYLLNTQYSIAEIAYFLNFNDPAYFNRLFKKKVGVPPGEFRRV